MNIFKNLFLLKKKSEKNKEFSSELIDQYIEIAKLVKEARISQNLTTKELSNISKIPERIINSIENNNQDIRPEYPFIRSILIKLEECLVLEKNKLLKLAVRERKSVKRGGKDFLYRNFDLINTWQGSLLYFFILVLTIFILKRYFILNVNVIEIQNIENQVNNK